jgi:hypothetical protein
MPHVSQGATVHRTGTAVSLRPLARPTTLTSVAIFFQALTADWLIAAHVPLAFVIFGLTTWITTQSIRMTGNEPR